MKSVNRVEREAELQTKIQQALASRFRDFPLFVTLGLWVCILPIIMVVVGWIWGFWEALIASLIILAVMITVCLTFCLRVKAGLGVISELSDLAVKRKERS